MVADNTDLAMLAADDPAKDRSRMSPLMVTVGMETLGTETATQAEVQDVRDVLVEAVVVAERDPY